MELNVSRSNLEQKFFDLCTKVVGDNGLQVYDMIYITGSSTLRLYIRNPETDTAVIEDCVKIDRAMTPYMEEDWIPEDFVLEVSSPGMFREIKTKEHFELAKDQRISMRLFSKNAEKYEELKGQKQFLAILQAINESDIEVKYLDKIIKVKLEDIKKVNLEPEI